MSVSTIHGYWSARDQCAHPMQKGMATDLAVPDIVENPSAQGWEGGLQSGDILEAAQLDVEVESTVTDVGVARANIPQDGREFGQLVGHRR